MKKALITEDIRCPLCGGMITALVSEEEDVTIMAIRCNDCSLTLWGEGHKGDDYIILENLINQWEAQEFPTEVKDIVTTLTRQQNDLLVYLTELNQKELEDIVGAKKKHKKIINELKGIVSLGKLWRNIAFLSLLVIAVLIFKLIS